MPGITANDTTKCREFALRFLHKFFLSPKSHRSLIRLKSQDPFKIRLGVIAYRCQSSLFFLHVSLFSFFVNLFVLFCFVACSSFNSVCVLVCFSFIVL